MKVNGVEIKGSAEEYLVLPRPTGPDIVFHATAVLDSSEFNSKCPEPAVKRVLVAGGWKEHVDDPDYQEAVNKQGELRFAWIFLKSLEPSKIEWSTIEPDKPSTWLNWRQELITAGFSSTEVNRIVNCVSSANSLDEEKLEEARESFLSGLAEASVKSSGLNTDLPDMPSGDPVSG